MDWKFEVSKKAPELVDKMVKEESNFSFFSLHILCRLIQWVQIYFLKSLDETANSQRYQSL